MSNKKELDEKELENVSGGSCGGGGGGDGGSGSSGVKCPDCQSTNVSIVAAKYGRTTYKCEDCKLQFDVQDVK